MGEAATVPDYIDSATGVRYLAADALSQLCGLTTYQVDNRFRPAAWGAPREFQWVAGRLWYAADALPALAESLFDAGHGDAAKRLGAWLDTQQTFDAGKPAQQDSRTAPRAPARAAASTPSGTAARVDQSSWLNTWEADR